MVGRKNPSKHFWGDLFTEFHVEQYQKMMTRLGELFTTIAFHQPPKGRWTRPWSTRRFNTSLLWKERNFCRESTGSSRLIWKMDTDNLGCTQANNSPKYTPSEKTNFISILICLSARPTPPKFFAGRQQRGVNHFLYGFTKSTKFRYVYPHTLTIFLAGRRGPGRGAGPTREKLSFYLNNW